jgi:hypothetical protein
VEYQRTGLMEVCCHLQCDLLSMPAVAQLEKDDKYGLVYELLKIFLTQRLDSYLEFQTANSTLLKDYGMFNCWTLND